MSDDEERDSIRANEMDERQEQSSPVDRRVAVEYRTVGEKVFFDRVKVHVARRTGLIFHRHRLSPRSSTSKAEPMPA